MLEMPECKIITVSLTLESSGGMDLFIQPSKKNPISHLFTCWKKNKQINRREFYVLSQNNHDFIGKWIQPIFIKYVVAN